MNPYRKKRRRTGIGGAAFSVLILLSAFVGFLVFYPQTPLPPEWNPRAPFHVTDKVTPITKWKFNVALGDAQQCLAALGPVARFNSLPDFEQSDQCHIRTQVALSRVGTAQMSEVNTRCQTALRMAMWEHHGIQPAANAHLGEGIARINHLSSYNCRQIRTVAGAGARMSTHATAEAIDIAGVTTQSGRTITLLQAWNGADPAAREFLRAIRDSACTWFQTTLGPEYNSLHADHFHLQHEGWGTCR